MVANGSETARRLGQAQSLMREAGLDLLLASPSADLRYLTGYARHPSERPTLLALPPDTDALMLVPQLEAPAAGQTGVRLVTYGETDSPYAVLSSALGQIRFSKIAITDQTWASVLLGLQATFDALFVSATPLLRRLRMVKSAQELELLARAGSAVDAAFAAIAPRPFAGRTERQIAAEINEFLQSLGVEAADWGPIVASGPNASSPHHMTSDREIQDGEAVILDFGCSVEGYQADITRTIHVGGPSDEFRHVYAIVDQAQGAGVETARSGVPAQMVDRAARGVIEAAGYGPFFVHRTGHGLGLEAHEEPYIVEGNDLLLEPGMVFSVEPGIYLPDRFGVRIEDIVAVTEQGARTLNNASHELAIV